MTSSVGLIISLLCLKKRGDIKEIRRVCKGYFLDLPQIDNIFNVMCVVKLINGLDVVYFLAWKLLDVLRFGLGVARDVEDLRRVKFFQELNGFGV